MRFGIDSIFGRVVTRLLILFIFTQPVYIALGMELEEPTVELDVPSSEKVEEQEISEETLTVDDVAELNTQEPSPSEQEDTVEGSDTSVGTGDIPSETDEITDNSEEGVNGNTTIEDKADDTKSLTESTETGHSNSDEAETNDNENTDNTEQNVDNDSINESDVTPESDDTENNPDESTTESDNETTVSTEEGSGSNGGGSSSDDETETDNVGDAEENTTETVATTTKDVATSTNEQTEDVAQEEKETTATSTSTSTSTEVETTEATNIVQNSESKYIFGEGDCTLVSDGEFYCVEEGPERQQMKGDPRVYSEKDREGDKEIFYFDGVEIKRITNNSYDDFAPTFDEETLRIVWQAMINDRLQIMIHDIPSNTTRQITTSRQNSSNPSIAGDIVVWQEWVETNWEIMMTDVDNDGQPFEVEQLTDNAVHDMFPAVYEDLITWQSERGSSWEVVVYDLRTGKRHTLEKDEDTKYENPRFVLLFDSKHENGDIETIGYDLDTGEMMELGTKSRPIPTEPLTPKDKAPEAFLREASTSTQVKVVESED